MIKAFLIVGILFSCSAVFASAERDTMPGNIQLSDSDEHNIIFDRADVMPAFPGGLDALVRFISKNLRYPVVARKNKLEGKVIIKFFVDVDGTVKEPVVLKDDVGAGAAEETIRVINMMPRWKPGSQRGTPVKVYYVLPVTFSLH